MYSTSVLFATTIASLLALGSALPSRRSVAYHDPSANGGSMLDNAGGGLGEPLNIIISGLSSAEVLTDGGIINYARAIGFSTECAGVHSGAAQSANLGDGHGWVDQTVELRQDYGSASTGTCLESVTGGNHFRVFRQNGAQANSGALFLAVSKEQSASHRHTITADGYDAGRNALVAVAIGKMSYGGVSYFTTAQNIHGLLPAGSTGVNHGISQDGIVTLLTVTIV